MGIRFFCPNGHKLNVKSELAGKRAICPDCGARLIVPVAGAVSSESSLDNLSAASAAADPQFSSQSVALEPAPVAAEQPVVWYFRTAAGEQLGPLTGNDLAASIADLHVLADTYLWRTGWTDWRLAGDAFAELPAALPVTTISPAPMLSLPEAPMPVELSTPLDDPPPPVLALPLVDVSVLPTSTVRRQSQQTPLLLTMLLVFTIATLIGVLIWVIRRNGGTENTPPPAERTPVAVPSTQS
jgi:hypothetical protein